VLGLGAAVAAAAEPDIDARTAPRGLLSGLFNEKPRVKPAPKAKADKTSPAEDKSRPMSTAARIAAEQQRQINAVLRRMEVCDRLRMIAFQISNEELLRQADELEARAREIYSRQTAHLSAPAPAPEPSTNADEKKLTARQTGRADGAADKELATALPAPRHSPPAALQPLGGDFEQREQSILNGTSMGRDKP
jgi:hypothetical protein